MKCGFVFVGRPKKIWAINIPDACIDSDDQGDIWFQIGDDMLLTTFENLSKFRKAVQLGFEYGKKILLLEIRHSYRIYWLTQFVMM